MDSIPSPFTIEIDGKPIVKVSDGAEDRTHAKTGTDAAVFTLKDSRLQSDEWILARSLAEDRSLLPKKVLWFKADSDAAVHAVTASQEGDSYRLKFADAGLMATDGEVYADLLGGELYPSRMVVYTDLL
ncbi:hypothetical protein BDW02DRAFT_502462 [Decorospora gaudefroyi]|uniref:Uncharacterized protein n=1 Tax=Decorospora gaudefroyi TaxID=184978 RepID=A0A6A5K619_9PLEO|nr:hypothetical protein BDW02DRAFT_502462 [Decorospora gaudefroyi]